MKTILFLLLLLLPLQVLSQEQVIAIGEIGGENTITFNLVGTETQIITVPFAPHNVSSISPDTSLISPPSNWLGRGNWSIAMKVTEVVAGDIDSFSVWMKPLLLNGKVSYNDSTFIKMNATNPTSYVSTSAQWFDPITASETWYTSILNGEIWGFAGVVFYVRQVATGAASTKASVTLTVYRYR
jgi:hypothetical protein